MEHNDSITSIGIWVALSHNQAALIDREDYALVCERRWMALRSEHRWYAYTCAYSPETKKSKNILMHRFIVGPKPGDILDHRDGDGLNNRRSNLRLATNAQNVRNSKKCKRNTTGFKGVFRNGGGSGSGYFYSQITCDGKRKCLGCFTSAEGAAIAYDNAAIQLFGEFARLNFPSVEDRPVIIKSTLKSQKEQVFEAVLAGNNSSGSVSRAIQMDVRHAAMYIRQLSDSGMVREIGKGSPIDGGKKCLLFEPAVDRYRSTGRIPKGSRKAKSIDPV